MKSTFSYRRENAMLIFRKILTYWDSILYGIILLWAAWAIYKINIKVADIPAILTSIRDYCMSLMLIMLLQNIVYTINKSNNINEQCSIDIYNGSSPEQKGEVLQMDEL